MESALLAMPHVTLDAQTLNLALLAIHLARPVAEPRKKTVPLASVELILPLL